MHRFSTTTRSAPSSAASTSAGVGGAVAPNGQPGQQVVHRPVAGDRSHAPAQVRQDPGPRRRDHGHAVVTSEPERHEGDGGHGGTLPTPADLAGRGASDPRGRVARRRSGRWLLRPQPHHVSVAVALGQLLPRRRRGRTSATSGPRASSAAHSPPRTVTASCPTSATARAPNRTPRCGGDRARPRSPNPRCTGMRSPSSRGSGSRWRARLLDRAASGLRFLLGPAAAHRGRPGRDLPSVGVGLRRQPALGRRRPRAAGAPGRGSTGRARWWAPSSARPAGRRSTTRPSPSARPASRRLVAWNALELAGHHRRRRPAPPGDRARGCRRRPVGRGAHDVGGRRSDGRRGRAASARSTRCYRCSCALVRRPSPR